MKILAVLMLLNLAALTARADQVCAGYDANGNCTGWIDTGGGGYTPNVPGYPGNPGENVQCICAGYDANGSCTYYVNCNQPAQ